MIGIMTAYLSVPMLIGAYFLPQVQKYMRIAAMRTSCHLGRVLVLTYDDGPGPDLTPKLLRLLASHHAKATFFLLGRRAEKHHEIASDIANAGHELACHSQDHLNAWKTSPWRALRDIAAGYRSLAGWIPANAIFRPPCGKLTAITALALRLRGAPIGWWTIDSGDTYAVLPDPQAIVHAVQRDGGGVVLMHDFDRSSSTHGTRSDYVLGTTKRLVELASEEDYQILTLGELLKCRCPTTS